MSRIAATFDALRQRGRKALIPFVTAGDPSPALTVPLMHALAAAGADVIELGVPFSDPMADGPTIQRSSERALRQGMTLQRVLEAIGEFRRTNDRVPVVTMGYANPIEALGPGKFAAHAQSAGVDGVLVVDYPPEESVDFAALMTARQIDPIFLLAPTSTEPRIKAVAALARGYVYYVSLRGVTGAAHLDLDDVRRKLPLLRSHIKLPIGVGFGIRDPETARRVAQVADAVVIGSRLVQEIEQSPADRVLDNVGRVARQMRDAIDRNSPDRGPRIPEERRT
jgi:tryptophan synthase alpha chain